MKKTNLDSTVFNSLFACIAAFAFVSCEQKPSASKTSQASAPASPISNSTSNQGVQSNTPSEKNLQTIVIPPQSLINPQEVSNQLKNIKISGPELSFTSTARDPYFSFPRLDPMPNGAILKIDITLPEKEMLQIFYQREGESAYSEKNAISKVRKSGRHTIEWKIDGPLNGRFRLDPGTTPGEYTIHNVEVSYQR